VNETVGGSVKINHLNAAYGFTLTPRVDYLWFSTTSLIAVIFMRATIHSFILA
jgi:hypothetical protein